MSSNQSVKGERWTSVGKGRGVAIQQRQQEHTAQHHNPQPKHISSNQSVEGERETSVGEGRGVAIQQRQQEHTAQHHNPQPKLMSSMPSVEEGREGDLCRRGQRCSHPAEAAEHTPQHHNPQPKHMSSMPSVEGERGTSVGEGRGVAIQQRQQNTQHSTTILSLNTCQACHQWREGGGPL
jgi:hypothetical protein